jgi:hypothetical protein
MVTWWVSLGHIGSQSQIHSAHLACVGRAVLKIPIYTWCGHEMPRMNKGILGFRKLDVYFCCPFDHVFGGRLF